MDSIIGKREVWRSLGTDSLTVARRRVVVVAASVEQEFEAARKRVGMPIDLVVMGQRRPAPLAVAESFEEPRGPTLREVYDAYMSDPTRDWSPRTRLAYETTRRLSLAILGERTSVGAITRARCREMIELLRWTPRNASKRYPGLSPVEIAEQARATNAIDLISAANINTYLNKLSGVFNWAAKEGLIARNPATGLKVPDPMAARDKRLPFTTAQLRAIFSAPIYVGCRDDQHGYASSGPHRPRNARFWLPLIGLFAGLRLNEACQLDVADVRVIEGVVAFVVTAASNEPTNDKRLKTASSERFVPVHPQLLDLGLMKLVALRKRAGAVKLFPEVGVGSTGYRSSTFSAWFARFCTKAGASSPKTCFHSFRHQFRDALREARVDRDIALALGGWSRPGGAGGTASIADVYGSGYRLPTLFEAISKLSYPDLDLSHLHEGGPAFTHDG